MSLLLVPLALLVLLGQPATSERGREMTLPLPHHLNQGEGAWIVVKVGSIGNAEIEVTTPGGRSLGTISPFGIRNGNQAGTYSLPLPPEVISDDHVTVRFSISQPGHSQRAPSDEELKGARVKVQRLPQ
jgi:hypothetical protein